jgi:serine/threonine-protein kinase HipA
VSARTTDLRSVEAVDIVRHGVRVGALRRTTHGARFEYERDFYEAHRTEPGGIAVHLPYARLVTESHGVNLPTYFAGLIPEGLRLKALLARAKTSEDDLFTLLLAAGSDCVGDLFPVLPGQSPDPLDRGHQELSPLDRVSFAELFKASLQSSAEPSVPGVQEKLSASVISFPFATAGRRWILKLNPPERPRLVENEHFFMELARRCGLDAARTHLVTDRTGASGLLVQRFDRERRGRRWRGVHQEDACQFLDRYPADKYRLSTSELAQGLAVCAAPRAEAARLIELVAFSYLIGNGDLHAKNVSINAAGGALQLTPAYDLLSTRPYGDRRLALKLEGRDDNVKRGHLMDLAERFGVPRRAVESRLDRVIRGVRQAVRELEVLGLDPRATRQLAELMKKRLADLAK